jgi:hypothetical protein
VTLVLAGNAGVKFSPQTVLVGTASLKVALFHEPIKEFLESKLHPILLSGATNINVRALYAELRNLFPLVGEFKRDSLL